MPAKLFYKYKRLCPNQNYLKFDHVVFKILTHKLNSIWSNFKAVMRFNVGFKKPDSYLNEISIEYTAVKSYTFNENIIIYSHASQRLNRAGAPKVCTVQAAFH